MYVNSNSLDNDKLIDWTTLAAQHVQLIVHTTNKKKRENVNVHYIF